MTISDKTECTDVYDKPHELCMDANIRGKYILEPTKLLISNHAEENNNLETYV